MLEKKRAGVGWGDIEHNTDIRKTLLGCAIFLPHFCDTKVTNTTNEMAIRTRYL